MIWHFIARLLTSHPAIFAFLVDRAQRTPYAHIWSPDGAEVYMGRWWLFNPYGRGPDGEQTAARIPWLPSIRLHHIKRADEDRHHHDHPWNARTIVLGGWYTEDRYLSGQELGQLWNAKAAHVSEQGWRASFQRERGYTGRLLFGQYHRISEVSPGGVWTLFITGRKQGTWGFEVDGQKVPWRTYLEERSQPIPTQASQTETP